jgi:methyl-accepting chemotaxis protein
MSVAERMRRAFGAAVQRARGGAARASTLDEAILYTRHDTALKAAESAMSTTQGAGATAAQQRTALDAAADHARLLTARERDVRGAAQRVRETLERAKLVALNAALEGARLGEPAGKAMVAVADEMRALAQRGLEAVDEQQGVLGQIDRERDKLSEQVEHSRQRAATLADDLLRAQAAQREAVNALGELGRGLHQTTGTDPETARVVVAAADHARGLVDALSALSSRRQSSLLWRALGPSIQPLLKLLGELDRGGRAGSRPS